MRKLCILGILIVYFAGFVYSAARMEHLRANGMNVLLALEPADPRALLMGDYMDLNYAAGNAILSAWRKSRESSRSAGRRAGEAASGRAVMRLERDMSELEGGRPPVAQFARLDDGTALNSDEIRIAFTVRGSRVVTAAPAFYFEEGTGTSYEDAAFGKLAVGSDGKTLLLALCDAEGRDIHPVKKAEVRDGR